MGRSSAAGRGEVNRRKTGPMRGRCSRAMVLAAGLVLPAVMHAQTPAPAAAYRAPRTKDGKPNLNGIWQALNDANWDIEAHSAAPGPLWQLGAQFALPPGAGVVDGGAIPYKPEALQK